MTDAASTNRRPIAWAMLIRRLHLWVGMLIAPSVLMFAFSGALQIFRLQEAHPGYAPPAVIEKLGRLHKDQVFAVGRKRPARAAPAAAEHEHDDAAGAAEAREHAEAAPAVAAPAAAPAEKPRPGPTLSKRLLQWFFTFVSAGLFVSTLLGIWMGVAVSRWKVSGRWLLAAGVALPIILILLPG